ncbi:tetratricopeptide repeat protein [Aliikangiella sp. IMCC44632]
MKSLINRILAIFIIVACCFIPVSIASPIELKGIPVSQVSPQQLIDVKAGFEALNQNKRMVANRIFTQLTKENPRAPINWIGLSHSATSLEQFNYAVEQASQLAKTSTEAEKLMIEMEQTYIANDAKARLSITEKLIKKYPQSSFAWEARGHSLADANQNVAARDAFSKAGELSPYDISPNLALGNNYLFKTPKDFAKAEQHFIKVVEIQPANFWGHISLGDAHRAQNNFSAALRDYSRALYLDPQNGSGLTKRGHVNTFLGNYKQARVDYDKAIQVAEPNMANYLANYKTFTHLYQGLPNETIKELQTVARNIDKSPVENHQKTQAKLFTMENLAMVGIHHEIIDSAENAIKAREKLIEAQLASVNDDNLKRSRRATNHFWKGTIQAQKGELVAATQSADKMKTLLVPIQNERKLEDFHELMAFISLKKEQYSEAVGHYNLANNEKIYVKFNKAIALEQTGDTKQAQKLFDEVARHNFNSVEFALLRNEAEQRNQFLSVSVGSASH